MNYKIKKLVREIKAAVMLNVSLMNQIWYKNKLTQKTLKVH